MTKGLPPEARSTVPWDEIVLSLQAHAGEAVLFDSFRDTARVRSLLTYVNSGGVRAFEALPGEVRANMRNSYVDYMGQRRGDLYLTYLPAAKP